MPPENKIFSNSIMPKLKRTDIVPQVGRTRRPQSHTGPAVAGTVCPEDSGEGNNSAAYFNQVTDIEDPQENSHGLDPQTEVPAAEVTNAEETTASRRRRCWNREKRLNLIRIYYKVTDNGRNLVGYRTQLHEEWQRLYPNHDTSPQTLSDYVRYIFKKNIISEAELRQLKQSEPSDEGQADTSQTADVTQEVGNIATGSTSPRALPNAGQQQNPEFDSELENLMSKYLAMYEGMPPAERPALSVLPAKHRRSEVIERVNLILEGRLSQSAELREVYHHVYCAALSVLEFLKVKTREKARSNKFHTPPWEKRLTANIDKLRRSIGILQSFIESTKPSAKQKRRISSMIPRGKAVESEEVLRMLDVQKQKLRAQATKLRKYKERTRRYHENKMFGESKAKFYRKLESDPHVTSVPTIKNLTEFWADLWENPVTHAEGAKWLPKVLGESERIDHMRPITITTTDVREAIGSMKDWKSPGSDKIHAYWWKNLPAVHPRLATEFRKALENPKRIPDFLTDGTTYMLPKKEGDLHPGDFRPITCLQVLYKAMTAILARKINHHLNNQKVMAWEQKGCRVGGQGCKESLIIDSVIMDHAKTRCRNMSVSWVDYRKAFDSVPHSWLIRVLEIYRVDEVIIRLLTHLMSRWRTQLILQTSETVKTRYLNIKRGIFQGDSFSPTWFCLALNPLSQLLNTTPYGYMLRRPLRITHQFYVDDLKLYAAGARQLASLLEIVSEFSGDIGMRFGLDKCSSLHLNKGKQTEGEETQLLNGMEIQCLKKGEYYRYLGLMQAAKIDPLMTREELLKNMRARMKKVLNTKLNSRNKIEALNSWAFPPVIYSLGVIKWPVTSLKQLDTEIRTTLTKYRMHHPKSSVCRLYLPRGSGGRGLFNFETAADIECRRLRSYFDQSPDNTYRLIMQTAADHQAFKVIQDASNNASRETEWSEKPLHGRYYHHLKHREIDFDASLTHLKVGYLFPETEAFIHAIQDQVVPTRSYIKNIQHTELESDQCRLCNTTTESIQHIISGCPVLAPTEYLLRHNMVCKVIHQGIGRNHQLVSAMRPVYRYFPEWKLESSGALVYWDTAIQTIKHIEHNRPDIVVVDKRQRRGFIIDVAVPIDENVSRSYSEKVRKYEELSYEIKSLYSLQDVVILPFVISANGLVHGKFGENLKRLGLDRTYLLECQKSVILGTCRIVRKVLQK